MALQQMQQGVMQRELAEKIIAQKQRQKEEEVTLHDTAPLIVDKAPTVEAKPAEGESRGHTWP